VLILLCLCLGSVVYLSLDFLFHSPKFDLAIREIRGLRNVPENQILMKLGAVEDQSKNLIALDLDEIRRSLELIPWIRSAVVRRVLPDKLIIEVTERVPVAFARVDHATFLVDDQGVLLESDSEFPHEFDFPVITVESPKAAEAGRCAYDQDKFWEYQDYVYNNYWGLEIDNLKFYAGQVGLDQAMFDQCLDSGVKKAEVDLDFKDAILRSFHGTPTFLINNKVVLHGMTSLDKFSAVIDPILAEAP